MKSGSRSSRSATGMRLVTADAAAPRARAASPARPPPPESGRRSSDAPPFDGAPLSPFVLCPLDLGSCAAVFGASAIAAILRGDRPGGAGGAQRVGPGEEAGKQAVGLLGTLDLRDVAAAVEHDLLGAGQPPRDV